MFEYCGLYVDDYNKEQHIENARIDSMRKEQLKSLDIENGIILPAKADPSVNWGIGGVQYPDFTFVEESKTPRFFGGNYEYDHQNIEKVDETVVYMGPFLCHWGHFICDQISRLWYVLPDIENCKIAYCGWNWGHPQTALWGNFLEFMHLLGLKDEQLIDIQKPTQFSHVIIPDISFADNAFYYQEFADIFKAVTSSVKKEDFEYHEKVYFSRGKFPGAQEKERGEEELENFFVENGYHVMIPEQMSLRQQIYYYQYAKHIAAVEGSITHSIVFAGKNLEVTILNKMNVINGYQRIIDNMMKLNITYVDVYMLDEPVCFGLGPFLIGINGHLKQYAKDRGMKLPKFSLETSRNNIKNSLWYKAKYKEIYSDAHNKSMLESQSICVERLKKEWLEEKQRRAAND